MPQGKEFKLVPGEKVECTYALREVSQNSLMGDINLTNYKLFFRPNGQKLEECTKYEVPYGMINKVQSTSDTITITCKDERVLKFKVEVG